MIQKLRIALLAAGFSLTASLAHAQVSISQLVPAGASQSSVLGLSSAASLGSAVAMGAQSNLNTLNESGASFAPMLVSSPSFSLNQSVLTSGGLSSIMQTAKNEIGSLNSAPGGLAISALLGPQVSLNSVNIANVSLATGGQASFLQSLDAAAPSMLTSTNLLSAISSAGGAVIMGNGNSQNAGAVINSIVVSTAGGPLTVSQSGPAGLLTITSSNVALASGQTSASIGSPP